MADRDEILNVKTHKNGGLSVHERVFYTLTDDHKLVQQRQSKLLSMLVEFLHDNGQIRPHDIDKILLEVVN